jgi:hypothetical protein
MTLHRFHRIALAGILTLASPVAALAQNVPGNAAAVKSAALGALSQIDRAQVQNILGLLSAGQIDSATAAVQIDATLTDTEAGSVLAEAKKANIDTQDAGSFLVTLSSAPGK